MMMHFLEKLCVAAVTAFLLSDWLWWKSGTVWNPEKTRLLCQGHHCFLELWPQLLLWVCSAPWLLAPPSACL